MLDKNRVVVENFCVEPNDRGYGEFWEMKWCVGRVDGLGRGRKEASVDEKRDRDVSLVGRGVDRGKISIKMSRRREFVKRRIGVKARSKWVLGEVFLLEEVRMNSGKRDLKRGKGVRVDEHWNRGGAVGRGIKRG